MFVYGDSKQSCLVAVLNVSEEKLAKLKSEVGASSDEDLKKKIIDIFEKERKENNLNSLEGIKDVHIDTENW